jgi:hypothetical protein
VFAAQVGAVFGEHEPVITEQRPPDRHHPTHQDHHHHEHPDHQHRTDPRHHVACVLEGVTGVEAEIDRPPPQHAGDCDQGTDLVAGGAGDQQLGGRGREQQVGRWLHLGFGSSGGKQLAQLHGVGPGDVAEHQIGSGAPGGFDLHLGEAQRPGQQRLEQVDVLDSPEGHRPGLDLEDATTQLEGAVRHPPTEPEQLDGLAGDAHHDDDGDEAHTPERPPVAPTEEQRHDDREEPPLEGLHRTEQHGQPAQALGIGEPGPVHEIHGGAGGTPCSGPAEPDTGGRPGEVDSSVGSGSRPVASTS